MSATTAEVLACHGVSVDFRGVRAVDDVSFAVGEGEVFGLIGPNGAGKTTLMNVLCGFQKPSRGHVTVSGRQTRGWAAQRFVRAGVGRTFQAVRPFPRLTVRENVELGALGVGAGLRTARRRADRLLDALHLAHRAEAAAASLPHGELRRLGIARALAGEPRVLLLDEPAAGANESESRELVHALRTIRAEFACSLVVIEHDMALIMNLCDRIHVLSFGRTISEGAPPHVQRDPAVLEAYLGYAKERPGC